MNNDAHNYYYPGEFLVGAVVVVILAEMAEHGNLRDLAFESELIEKYENKVLIRAKIKCEADAEAWLLSYQRVSATKWNVRKTYPGVERLRYRKDYVCHHSTFSKEMAVEGYNKRGKSKNCQCPAKMSVVIQLETSQDQYAKRGFFGKISIAGQHNHSTSNAEALSLLPPPDSLRSVFEGYFLDGLGISEASRFHVEKMELAECTETDLADATKNPRYRTVLHWHTQWLAKDQGPRTGDGMIDTLNDKMDAYSSIGCQVVVRRDPLVVIIITPVMHRAQELCDASGICFIDSTASCDANNHTITFVLTTCAAGAVPLAVIITSGQSQADYTAAFMLLKQSCGNMFGGASHPEVFMTDDSDAERNALAAIWPESLLRLCLFHVPQANWRWLWDSKNEIAKDDRPLLMEEFRKIMMATSKEGALEAFHAGTMSQLSCKYPRWQKRVEKYFDRREAWCIAWRSAVHRGHHTNNYSEVTVRLFKDIVLSRLKAYNVVSLVDFVCTAMEQYYTKRLLEFAHSRVATPHILLRKQTSKAVYVDAGAIKRTTESTFQIPSETDPSVSYTVDITVGICSCQDGMGGRFCKHQAAISLHMPDVLLPNTPPVDAAARHRMAVLALGEKAQPTSFYEPYTTDNQLSNSMRSSAAGCSNLVPQSSEPMDHGSVHQPSEEPTSAEILPTAVDDSNSLVKSVVGLINQLHDRFGTSSPGCARVLTRLRNVQTGTQWENFWHSFGGAVPLRHHHRAAIRVQPTSLARRRPGISRGSKRLASGRPPSTDPLRRTTKRPRCLSYNVKRNQPNAKPHGDGH